MKKRFWISAAAVVVVGAVGVGGFMLTTGRKPAASAAGPAAAQTVAVVKTDLSDTQEFSGTLGFGGEQPVKGRRPGTVTWVPASGAEIDRGKPLYKVDNFPVTLFFGGTPLWRKLDAEGTKGPDVKIVKENLAALGYPVGKKDDELTAAAIAAIKRWQKAQKLEETGVIDIGDVVILSGRIRVNTIKVQLPAPAEGELMSVTATDKSVTVAVDAAQIGTLKQGGKVTIALPDGQDTPGAIGEISRTAKSDGKSGAPPDPGAPGGAEAKINVAVTLDNPAAAGTLESAPVRVRVTSVTKQGVLAVPVTALLALRGGGYALQVSEGGKTSLMPVQTGMFATGLVEVSGAGIREGLQVVTTS